MRTYSTIFFDIDNTLLDFYKAEEVAIRKVLMAHSLPYDDETVKTYSKINQSYWERFEKGEIPKSEFFEGRFKTLLSVLNRDGNTSAIANDYFEALSEGYFKIDGADDILTVLKNRGYKLYATTNGIALTQYKRIKNSGLERFFDGIFVSEEAGHQKPEKEYFDYIIDKIPEKDRSKILIIGDSQSSDILGGINAKIDTCWFNFQNTAPKYNSRYEITKLCELEKILP